MRSTTSAATLAMVESFEGAGVAQPHDEALGELVGFAFLLARELEQRGIACQRAEFAGQT